ncbi:MAG TPA: pirin family protein [Anaerolineales bacterium]|nr:pirin family protein [Anaerolineales bacterium]HNN14599.1 pirin family protein [Anaerolineales bacterium]HNO30647.1 pirin family protein [Anaerolineales bacterium]
MTNFRTISDVIDPQLVVEGAGVLLRRSIAPRQSNEHDPFLLFDHFAFNNPIEGPIRGFPTHPHRGIETVTYMLEGTVRHRDSLGNMGTIGEGDVQWMTSGSGILHEEMPQRSLQGNIYGFQLWVNLPAAQKMSPPRYQEVNASTIPVIEKDGATIRLVAGEVDGQRGPVTEIAAAPLYMDVKLAPGARFVYPISGGHTALAYVFQGTGEFAGEVIESVSMVAFKDDGDHIEVKTEAGVQFMLIAGAPFKEPIVPYGPFVMNTVEEIQQAIRELRNGTFIK